MPQIPECPTCGFKHHLEGFEMELCSRMHTTSKTALGAYRFYMIGFDQELVDRLKPKICAFGDPIEGCQELASEEVRYSVSPDTYDWSCPAHALVVKK